MSETPIINVDTTAAQQKIDALRALFVPRATSKCPDSHDAMKPVPNRADRRRAARKRS